MTRTEIKEIMEYYKNKAQTEREIGNELEALCCEEYARHYENILNKSKLT